MGHKEHAGTRDSWVKVDYKDNGTVHVYIGAKDERGSHDHFIYDSKTGERIKSYHRGQCDECSSGSKWNLLNIGGG